MIYCEPEMQDVFSDEYIEARAKFRRACRERGVAVRQWENPTPGPAQVDLTTDVALFGPEGSRKLLVINSGTHGVEGLVGAGCQLAWIKGDGAAKLPADTAVLMIHLLNPWGTAWGRRQNEDNVDLNRNFVDFGRPLPKNDYYAEISAALSCAGHDGFSEAGDQMISNFRRRYGEAAFATALFAGQYLDAVGVGFGGSRPVWSRLTLEEILGCYGSKASDVVFLDVHSGVGPYGHGMLISPSPVGSETFSRGSRWFGPGLLSLDDGKIPYPVRGDLLSAVQRILPASRVLSLALEYGTFEVSDLLRLQVEDCRVELSGRPISEAGLRVRKRLRDFFYPSAGDWAELVQFRTNQVVRQGLSGLASLD